LDSENIQNKLSEKEKDERLATGIWWLSRGRIGWANKLVNEAPSSLQDVGEWVRERSEEDFEGVTPIDNNVWNDPKISANKRDDARKSMVFLNDSYEKWSISHDDDDAISAETVSNLSLDIIREISPMELSGDAQELLEKNLDRLSNNYVPADSSAEGKYLPANFLNESEDV
jgi:hypothetical protein